MSDCIFCKIVAGELPCYKLYEDEEFLAFLDIDPLVKGHSIVIPKKHARWVYDVENFGEYWEAAKKVTEKLQNAVDHSFISYLTYGLDVPHAHIQILPRNKADQDEIVPTSAKKPDYDLAELAEKIKKVE